MRSLSLSATMLALLALAACDERRSNRRDTGVRADAPVTDAATPDDASVVPDAFLVASLDAFVPPPDARASVDAFAPGDAPRDAGRDAGLRDAGTDARAADAGSDAGRDTGPRADAGPALSTTFPTSSATICSFEACTTLGTGGGGAYFRASDYLEQSVSFSLASITELTLAFRMSDLTSGCAVGMPNTFEVSVNGVVVGSYGWTTGATPAGDRDIAETFSFAPISAVAGSTYTIRITATTTVCPGGSSWNWYPDGTASAR